MLIFIDVICDDHIGTVSFQTLSYNGALRYSVENGDDAVYSTDNRHPQLILLGNYVLRLVYAPPTDSDSARRHVRLHEVRTCTDVTRHVRLLEIRTHTSNTGFVRLSKTQTYYQPQPDIKLISVCCYRVGRTGGATSLATRSVAACSWSHSLTSRVF